MNEAHEAEEEEEADFEPKSACQAKTCPAPWQMRKPNCEHVELVSLHWQANIEAQLAAAGEDVTSQRMWTPRISKLVKQTAWDDARLSRNREPTVKVTGMMI